MQTQGFFDQTLISKYNTQGPRYTSYPTALEFSDNFDVDLFPKALSAAPNKALSLYIHIPFCHSLCYYCGCNKIVTRHQHKADTYLDFLEKELIYRAAQVSDQVVSQIHFGGGTPSFLTKKQLSRIVDTLNQHFSIAKDAEISIEIDPRNIDLEFANDLYTLGFNRISIGVQDTNKRVQEAINRVQSIDFIQRFIDRAKQIGISSVNIDLIYGLPHQTQSTFSETLTTIQCLNTDRISLFSYAHMPQRFAAQRKIKNDWLANGEQKLRLMQQAITSFSENGFQMIGMDHFAKSNDELAIALNKGRLHRNFQGYTTQQNTSLIGLGVSAISSINDIYSQNNKNLKAYYQSVERHSHGTEKGLLLDKDDIIRRDVISSLMCNMQVNKQQISETHQIDFDQYFSQQITSLEVFFNDHLMTNTRNRLTVAPKARLLVRNICMSFDKYMEKHLNKQRFSQVM